MREKRATNSTIAKPGEVLKAIRSERGWTLQQVSEKTGMPISTLSKIEHGKMSLTYDKITKLSRGLGFDIDRFFATDIPAAMVKDIPTPTGRRSITRGREGTVMDSEVYASVYPATDFLHKKILPIVTEAKARSREEFGALLRHSGEEYSYVTEGAIELHTELYAPLLLEVGDSVYFDSSMAHAYIAAAPGPCRLVTVCSADSVELRHEMESAPQFAETALTIVRASS